MWNLGNWHEPICRSGIEMKTERMDVWTHCGGRRGEIIWEIGIDLCALLYIK